VEPVTADALLTVRLTELTERAAAAGRPIAAHATVEALAAIVAQVGWRATAELLDTMALAIRVTQGDVEAIQWALLTAGEDDEDEAEP
jgi:hypothetical protein